MPIYKLLDTNKPTNVYKCVFRYNIHGYYEYIEPALGSFPSVLILCLTPLMAFLSFPFILPITKGDGRVIMFWSENRLDVTTPSISNAKSTFSYNPKAPPPYPPDSCFLFFTVKLLNSVMYNQTYV